MSMLSWLPLGSLNESGNEPLSSDVSVKRPPGLGRARADRIERVEPGRKPGVCPEWQVSLAPIVPIDRAVVLPGNRAQGTGTAFEAMVEIGAEPVDPRFRTIHDRMSAEVVVGSVPGIVFVGEPEKSVTELVRKNE